MNRIRIALSLAVIMMMIPLMAAAVTVDEVTNVHVADRTKYVTDMAGVLDAQTVDALNSTIASVWQSTSAEMVVVVVDEVDPAYTPDEFATRLFEKWKIGKSDKDNGLLMLVSTGDRKAVIRTGYGVEGVVPDIIAGRIIRNDMIPWFRQGDYASGIKAGVAALTETLSDPEAAEELRSTLPNDRLSPADEDVDTGEIFNFYLYFCAFVGVVCLIIVIMVILSSRGKEEVIRWRNCASVRNIILFCVFLSLGCALPAYLILIYKMHRLRRHKRLCQNCGTRMKLVDEEHDNDYLTPAQDMEEKLNSIDYDVWLCPNCNTTEVIPYINLHNNYTVCPRCHARAMSLIDSRVAVNPTTRSEGVRINTYACRACGYRDNRQSRIPRKSNDDAALAAGVIAGSILGGRGGGGGFGGGFGGGSFGGGLTGGGGASGGW
ncbi:MAG: TPM domain-containing protein [Lachnoclostridium sp.]|nr:TPM domain-containing protein [Lachnoclostridium sp.]